MAFALTAVGQIAFPVADVDRAEAFFGTALGLRKLFRFGDLAFFDCGGVRLMVEKVTDPTVISHASVLYFRCADLALAVRQLKERGVVFRSEPHRIAQLEDHDLWMAFFEDPDGHVLALMQEAPKGYQPPSAG